MIITIDGPSASGKSTVARELARRLGIYYLNTGMLYRALGYLLIHHCNYNEINLVNPQEADVAVCLKHKNLIYSYDVDGKVHIFFQGLDITPHLKTSEIDRAASLVSAQPIARVKLLEFQRSFAEKHDLVAEGRDVGSVVFPEAQIKFYLTASIEVRATHWRADRARSGEQFTLAESIEKLAARDKRDLERAVSPLVVPGGAYIVDSSHLTKEETVEHLFEIVQKKIKREE